MELDRIATEQRNDKSVHIDRLSTIEMVKLINEEDMNVAPAVEKELESVARAVDMITEKLQNGGRLIYSGCGTSGRLGVLDASECPPTYSVPEGMVIGLIAGGKEAMFKAVEGAEDNEELGALDLKDIDFSQNDILVGIAASGRTPYVYGAMKYAKSIGAKVISVTCAKGSVIDTFADCSIAPMPGPEVVTGSTRMKSGTAEKMVLNMLSTGAMIKLGKVYGNLMVDVKPSNEKLVERCIRVVRTATDCSREDAIKALTQCDYHPKTAIVMILCNMNASDARTALYKANGHVSDAIG
ncbi:MAG: N-acetylmuramic acid 6-phosphate etherase [Lachnospiraceae bacterium]|nr:N-acetylmuramic acid 6-phosphate etherase [Lachnospiraceae bacterium]